MLYDSQSQETPLQLLGEFAWQVSFGEGRVLIRNNIVIFLRIRRKVKIKNVERKKLQHPALASKKKKLGNQISSFQLDHRCARTAFVRSSCRETLHMRMPL